MTGRSCSNLWKSTERTTSKVQSTDKTPRILHLIDSGGPGGAETVFLELVRGLPALGWESVPVVPEVDWLAGALREAGFEPECLPAKGRFALGYARRLRALIRKERIDLVQTHLLGTSVYSTLACLGTSVPVVSTFHGHPDISRDDRLVRVKLRILGRPLNRVVCVSDSLRAHFEASGPFPRGAEVIPNGIDTKVFAPGRPGGLRSEIGIASDARLIGAVGNIRTSKDYATLLRAFAQVRLVVPSSHLVVVGQGQGALFEELRALQTGLGLADSCHFVGFREDIADVLRSLDLFVLSSSDEGFSLATVQAMATGRPVVATQCGGPEQIVGESGAAVFVPVRDPDALAKAMIDVLRRPDFAQRLGAAGRARAVDTFSTERMLLRYSELYLSRLAER
jgi:glycosyltransferase involved in cell wall biosynthesis